MSEDTIVVNIDDSQLSEVLLKLRSLGEESEKTTGRKKLSTSLPGINREMRLILGQVPGMREAMRYYFVLKRLELGKARMEADILGGAFLGGAMPAYLAIWATVIILTREILKLKRADERREEQYKHFILRQRGWSAEDYARLTGTLESYYRSDPG